MRKEHTAAAHLMADKVDQMTIADPILRLHRVREVRADDAADPVDWHFSAAVALRLCVRACLLSRHDTHVMMLLLYIQIPDA
uniref:Uncharacterized protein n=1 Tax=Peronospora matthiolae TaxID=2874970 RepID=A0AAV1U441_9STRA